MNALLWVIAIYGLLNLGLLIALCTTQREGGSVLGNAIFTGFGLWAAYLLAQGGCHG